MNRQHMYNALYVPIRTVSETNRASHEHWRVRQRRTKEQRMAVWAFMGGTFQRAGPWKVKLTRIAPRALDDDNLAGALKAIRDQVAECLGAPNDRDGFEWVYGQRRGLAREYGVEIEIERPKVKPEKLSEE